MLSDKIIGRRERLPTTKVFAKAGLDNETSAMCRHQQQFGIDVQCSTLVINFNNIFSIGHLYWAGQSMNPLPSQILERWWLLSLPPIAASNVGSSMQKQQLFLAFLLLLLSIQGRPQSSFLYSFKRYGVKAIKSDHTIDSIRRAGHLKGITKKDVKQNKMQTLQNLDSLCVLLSRVFARYKAEKGFDFNTSDSIILVYQTSVETSLRDFIVISGSDTLSFREKWRQIGVHSAVREVEYVRFQDDRIVNGLRKVDSRDSLLTLVSKNDFETAQKLANQNAVLDGVYSTILFARRNTKTYLIKELFLPPFEFVPIMRVE
ncbi:MAG: hypothetical protein WBP58_14575 [Chitinophagaceae bacterium]